MYVCLREGDRKIKLQLPPRTCMHASDDQSRYSLHHTYMSVETHKTDEMTLKGFNKYDSSK